MKLCQKPPGGTGLRAFDFGMAISDTLVRTYVLDKGFRRLRRKRNVCRDWCMAQWNTSPIYGKVGSAVGLESLSASRRTG